MGARIFLWTTDLELFLPSTRTTRNQHMKQPRVLTVKTFPWTTDQELFPPLVRTSKNQLTKQHLRSKEKTSPLMKMDCHPWKWTRRNLLKNPIRSLKHLETVSSQLIYHLRRCQRMIPAFLVLTKMRKLL